MADKQASDLFFSTGAPVNIKIEGKTSPVIDKPLPPGMVKQLAYRIINDEQKKSFEEGMELNFAFSVEYIGRFRVHLYRQRGDTAMVIRYIKSRIPSIEDLNLPTILKQLVVKAQGLVLLVGATGAGKSTTLASMIDHRNTTMTGHILTIEEPIEYLHPQKKSVVNQREVGLDTLSFANALINAKREAPDVILVGEIRDREAMQQLLAYADTGHLCLATVHANNANQTLDRIIQFFPDSARPQLLQDLSANLRAIVSQRLIPGIGGKRVPAVEILLKSPEIAGLIAKGDVGSLTQAIAKSSEPGMQTLDQSLFALYESGKISEHEALENAVFPEELAKKFRHASGARDDASYEGFTIGS